MRILYAVVVLLAAGSVAAGPFSINLAWDPVEHPELAAYRVYITVPALQHSETREASSTVTTCTQTGNPYPCVKFTVDNLECHEHQIKAKAVNVDGTESAGFSNEVIGWPRDATGDCRGDGSNPLPPPSNLEILE